MRNVDGMVKNGVGDEMKEEGKTGSSYTVSISREASAPSTSSTATVNE